MGPSTEIAWRKWLNGKKEKLKLDMPNISPEGPWEAFECMEVLRQVLEKLETFASQNSQANVSDEAQ